MSVYAFGDTITIWVVLLDALGVAITTAIDANFSEAIDREAADGTLTAATVGTWAHRNNGRYYATIGSAVEGKYSGTITYAGPPVQVFSWEADVLPAAANPAAIATAIADLFDQPVSDFTNSNTLGGRIKMITAGTRS